MKDIKGCFQNLSPSLCEVGQTQMCGGMLPLTSSVTVGQELNLSEPQCAPVVVSERCHGDEMSVMRWDIQQDAW